MTYFGNRLGVMKSDFFSKQTSLILNGFGI